MAKTPVAEALKGGLYTRVVGRRILYFDSLSSTMDQAAKEAEKGIVEGAVVMCRRQRAGRGRFGRAWVSDDGGLLLSVVFYPSTEALPFISVITALAVARTIERETELFPVIKWPNDVMVNGKKVCGVLVENVSEGAATRSIAGIGLNVNMDPKDAPDIADTAASLRSETGREMNDGTLLRRLLHELDALYVDLKQGRSPVEEWRRRLDTLGKRVKVRWGGEVMEGVAEDVDSLGHLRLRQDNGALVTLPAGEVTLNPHAPTNPN